MSCADKFRKILMPLSWAYGALINVRCAYFCGRLYKRFRPSVPTICVGNLTVGGTGKTPHVEYLLRLLLGSGFKAAVVSRGYRRATKGMVVADDSTTARDIGDEPFQMKQHFPEAAVVASVDRAKAISMLEARRSADRPDAVVLDDGFQHLQVKAGMYVLLVDYSRPIFSDCVFPAGNMREPFSQRLRADIMVVTKCPLSLSTEEAEAFKSRLRAGERKVFFSTMVHGGMRSVFPEFAASDLEQVVAASRNVLAVAGIARPQPFFDAVKRYAPNAETVRFADHYNFTRSDVERLNAFAAAHSDAAVVATEKDAARLVGFKAQMSPELQKSLFALPVRVEFLFGGSSEFDKIITNYVRENPRNS